jgi:glutaconate CoA-transferase subunit B
LPRGTGPYRVVTSLAVLGYEDASKRMQLLATQPGVTVEDVAASTGFELLLAERIEENGAPTTGELRILRDEIDPEHLYI